MKILTLNTIKNDSKASSILDFLRFFSALIVFLFHFYVPVPGYQAVMVFFVLSGYFISTNVISSVISNRWNWREYLLKRVTRLWVVLLPCLFLSLMWAKIQISIFGKSDATNYLDIKTFIGNLFFLQDIIVNQYGLNGPLWSLSYEFWYYILFPCIVLIICSNKKSTKVIYSIIFFAIAIFVGRLIMEYFLIWLLGASIPLIKPIVVKSKKTVYLLTLTSLVLTLFSTKYPYLLIKSYNPWWKSPGIQFYADLSVGITFAILVYIVVSLFKETSVNKVRNMNKLLAGFSYTLYLTHFPLMYIIITWRSTNYWTFNHFETILMKPLLGFSVFFYAWLIASLTEKHTDKVRQFVFKLIFKDKSEPIKDKNSVTNF